MRMIDLLYRVLRDILFMMDAESIHNATVLKFKIASEIPFIRTVIRNFFKVKMEFEYLGVKFVNPLGLAAGFDKNGEVFDFIEAMGFGFCEVGSVSFRPQKGNPKPRIFRVLEEQAIINHIGLENKGAYAVAKNIERKKKRVSFPVGINIVKNNDTELKDAANNIFECFKVMKDLGDFFVFNISCPNVGEVKINIYDYILKIADRISMVYVKKPKFIKLSPDLDEREIEVAVKACMECGFGVIAGNTTKRRDILKSRSYDDIKGGVSGKPLNRLSFEMLGKIRRIDDKIPVISCGGIFDRSDIDMRRKMNVSLFEVYTSFIYYGPGIVRKLLCDVK